jgi:hypothetical protein
MHLPPGLSFMFGFGFHTKWLLPTCVTLSDSFLGVIYGVKDTFGDRVLVVVILLTVGDLVQ